MRALTMDELAFVSGGSTVLVTAQRPPPRPNTVDPLDGLGIEGYDLGEDCGWGINVNFDISAEDFANLLAALTSNQTVGMAAINFGMLTGQISSEKVNGTTIHTISFGDSATKIRVSDFGSDGSLDRVIFDRSGTTRDLIWVPGSGFQPYVP